MFARVEERNVEQDAAEQLVIHAGRHLVAIGPPQRLVEDGDGKIVRLLQSAEFAAHVLLTVPRGIARLEEEVAVVVPAVDLSDVGVWIWRRAGVDLIEVPAPRRVGDRAPGAAHIVGRTDTGAPVVPERILAYGRERLAHGVILNHSVDRLVLEHEAVRKVPTR